MAIHPRDKMSDNPRMQCSVCGKWKRLYTKDRRPPFDLHQTFFGGCTFGGGDHLAGDHVDVCALCCEIECRKLASPEQLAWAAKQQPLPPPPQEQT